MLKFFQKLGKCLMLPIAVLPIAGILMRLGQNDILEALGLGADSPLSFLSVVGGSIFDNLPLLFAIGIAVGFAIENNGTAALAGAISYFIINDGVIYINSPERLASIAEKYDQPLFANMEVNMGVLSGIMAGIIGGLCYNKFKDTKLPEWLGFFSGRRSVAIVAGLLSAALTLPLGLAWPWIQLPINSVGLYIIGAGAFGVFLFGFLNRLLIPLGLHHVLNTLFWFQFGEFYNTKEQVMVNGDLNRFFAEDPTAGGFMAGFFPIMMFALPAACLAMYTCAKSNRKKAVSGVLFSLAFTSFLTGITEPIEFMFMFLAPVLYLIHALLTGVSMAVMYVLDVKLGFTFSAGLIDYVLNFNLATKPLLLIPVGAAFFVIYYLLFIFFIKKFDLKTVGREDETVVSEDEAKAAANAKPADQSLTALATRYIDLLGGKENIESIESCITRIRLVLKDNSNISDVDIKANGAQGVIKAGDGVTQVIVGTKAEALVDEMKKQL